MAIHVRATNTVKLKIASLLRRMLTLALGFSLCFILVSALVMYIIKEYVLPEQGSSFVTYVPPVQKEQKKESRRKTQEDSEAASSAMAAPPAPVIIAQSSDITFDLTFTTDDLVQGDSGFEGFSPVGFGAADLGDGLGAGIGDGIGKGDGKGGGKRYGDGFNDDIQVVLLLDASGSMDQLFQAASACMEDVLVALSNADINGKKAKVNVGIVIYGQAEQDGAPIKLSPFTTAVNQIRSRLSEVSCNGGLEACGHAISYAVDNFEWNRRDRDDMLKVIFIAGNEPFSQGTIDYRDAIRKATSQNIIVNTIHCGGKNEEWEEAAALGNGQGMHADFAQTNTPATPQDIFAVLKELHNCKPLPIGSPAIQKKHITMLNAAKGPSKADTAIMNKWVRDNKQRIITGYDWDAIEIYRRTPTDQFSIESLGGVGNLPISFRGKSEQELITFLSKEANRRSNLLTQYQAMKSSGELGDLLLNALQDQAETKGITIEF